MSAPLAHAAPPVGNEEARADARAPRASTTARKRHPCPTCNATGEIRRSFGFAIHGDRSTEAYAIVPCDTCKGTGAQPIGWVRPGVRGVQMPDHLVPRSLRSPSRSSMALYEGVRAIHPLNAPTKEEFLVRVEAGFRGAIIAGERVTESIREASRILGELVRAVQPKSPTIVSLEDFKAELGVGCLLPDRSAFARFLPALARYDDDAMDALGYMAGPTGRHFL